MKLVHDAKLDEYWAMAQKLPVQPMTVKLETLKPIAGADHPHLDGILANAVCKDLNLGWIDVPHDSVLFVPTPLSVERWIDELPLWSCNHFEAVESEVRYTRYTQKSGDNPTTLPAQTATLERPKPMRLPSSQNGQYQHYLLPLRTEMADYWETTCLGNLDEVRRLLNLITSVGKKKKPGYGSVARWTVEPIDTFEFKRPSPARSGVLQSWTNPHWDSRLWQLCS